MRVKTVISATVPYLIICMVFTAYVLWNGSVVLGTFIFLFDSAAYFLQETNQITSLLYIFHKCFTYGRILSFSLFLYCSLLYFATSMKYFPWGLSEGSNIALLMLVFIAVVKYPVSRCYFSLLLHRWLQFIIILLCIHSPLLITDTTFSTSSVYFVGILL